MEQHIINISPQSKFKQFDIIPATDHNLIDDDPLDLSRDRKRKSKSSRKHNQSAPETVTNLSHEATLAILKEWKILKEGLPNSIYVRAYEGRIDLLTAVIVGRPGTPFHGGLFFYTIKFPSNYPKSPPKFNVYTFAEKNLSWNPTSDPDHIVCRHIPMKPACLDKNLNILETLLWIQSNIFGSNPYFYMSDFIKPNYNPSTYNQDIFVFNCLTMLSVLYQPPKHFEEFVVQHFLHNCESILIAYKAYIADAEKTVDTEVQEEEEEESRISMMWVYYRMLVRAFRKIGSTSPMVKEFPARSYWWLAFFTIVIILFVAVMMVLIRIFGNWDNPGFGP